MLRRLKLSPAEVACETLLRLNDDELLAVLQALERLLAAKLTLRGPLTHEQAQAAVLAAPAGSS